jgi:hypothetical protein
MAKLQDNLDLLEHEILNLPQWVREYATYTGFQEAWPDPSQVHAALATHLPLKLQAHPAANVQELLQAVGIMVIVKIGDERIAWFATINADEAEDLQQLYNSPAYSQIRHQLGINAHWIFLLNPKSIDLYTRQDLYEAHMDVLELEDRPEAVVVSL